MRYEKRMTDNSRVEEKLAHAQQREPWPWWLWCTIIKLNRHRPLFCCCLQTFWVLTSLATPISHICSLVWPKKKSTIVSSQFVLKSSNYSFLPFGRLIWIFVYVLAAQTPAGQVALNSKQWVTVCGRIWKNSLRDFKKILLL